MRRLRGHRFTSWQHELVRMWRQHGPVLLAEIVPVLALLALLAGALWAIGEHARYKSALREAETRRYLAEFEQGPVAEAWARLDAAWRADEGRLAAKLEVADSGRLDGRPATAAADAGLLEAIDRHDLGDEIAVVLAYIKRLALCIDIGACDRAMAAARLGVATSRFQERFGVVVAEAMPDEPLERYAAIVAPQPAAGGPGPWHAAR